MYKIILLILIIINIFLFFYLLIKKKRIIKEYKDTIKTNFKEEEKELQNEIEEKKKLYNEILAQEEEKRNLIISQQKELINKEIENFKKEEQKKATDELFREFNLFQEDIKLQKEEYLEELKKVRAELEDFRLRRASINEAILRERELNEKEDFYRICLSEDDVEDIELLKTMTARLRHKELIPKLIWDSLVSRPTQEMIKRVTNNQESGGIYKITYIPTGESYIGRTTNFKTRWKNHIMTALGLEKVASSTLHTHMAQHGIQNYTFEILEIVDKDKQSEREKFYIELYDTKQQFNQKSGG